MKVFTYLILCSAILSYHAKVRAENEILTLEVIDPFVEMHTGPGRGFPIFYVIEQGETVEVLTRRPDWYELRAENGKIGWSTAAQISRTLQPTGEPVDLPTVSYGDYLKNSWRVGFSLGKLTADKINSDQNLDAEADTTSLTIGYRPFSFVSVEMEVGKIYTPTQRGNSWGFNLMLEPISKWRFSPYFLLGAGQINLESQSESLQNTLLDADTFYVYEIGTNFYIGRNFLLNGGFRGYTIDTENDSEGVARWHFGFNAFF